MAMFNSYSDITRWYTIQLGDHMIHPRRLGGEVDLALGPKLDIRVTGEGTSLGYRARKHKDSPGVEGAPIFRQNMTTSYLVGG